MTTWKCCLACLAIAMALTCSSRVGAQKPVEIGDYVLHRNLLYREEVTCSDAELRACRLDVYAPATVGKFATVVWFHGGGLTSGERTIPDGLKRQGIAVVTADYRLSPQVKAPVYIDDAAAAVAWAFRHIKEFGGDPDLVFVAGHSAGGYLTCMVGLDKRWLAAYGIDADRIAGLIPYSGQTITHFTIRAERGIPREQPVVDDLAPLYHVRRDAPPILLITGDRDSELLGRYEETAYFWRMLQIAGHADVEIHELQGFDHGQMVKPAHGLLLRFTERVASHSKPSSP
jgi:acetyl esterase/lipase